MLQCGEVIAAFVILPDIIYPLGDEAQLHVSLCQADEI